MEEPISVKSHGPLSCLRLRRSVAHGCAMAEDLLPGAVRMTGDTIQEAEEVLGMLTMGGSDLSGKEGGSDLSGKKQGGSGAAAAGRLRAGEQLRLDKGTAAAGRAKRLR